ncbi:MAG: cobalamin biosynthesis protein CobD [Synergistes sp.]|nr:cobalamin biosynthesis protein CobD [Synergistes sp.]
MQIIAALLLDALIGDPQWPPHPVTLIGKLITYCEQKLYSARDGKIRGALLAAAVIAVTAAAVLVLEGIAGLIGTWLQYIVTIYLLFAAIAFKSLKDEALPVEQALLSGDVPAARRLVGRIVGRDTDRLDEAGITRAAVETIAESSVDGVISVLFWSAVGAFFGQAALFAWIFKAASTMDSMIGYDDERYRDFGWAAAKLDDLLNFIPARIGGIITIGAGALANMDWRRAWKIFLRDRKNHKSPNSAHSESVYAGLLGIRLGGGAYYGGEWESRPHLGDSLRDPEPKDISRAVRILNLSVVICAVIILILAWFTK